MTDNALACLMVWIGYLGVIFAPIFAVYVFDRGIMCWASFAFIDFRLAGQAAGS